MIDKLTNMIGNWLAAYAKVQQSRNVDEVFTSYQVLEELNYYYAGSDMQPTGILALDPEYRFGSKFWQPVDLTPAMLEKWVKAMNSDFIGLSSPCGWRIFDRNDTLIGILYGKEKVVVKLEKDGQISVYAPADQLLDKF